MTKRATILYVDDEPINLMLFTSNFGDTYQVLTAKSGADGLAVLEGTPDVRAVISDMKMPGMNGIDFVTKAKEMRPDTAFFILSGYEFIDEISIAIKSGLIINYFRKPFSINSISSALETAIK